MAPFKCDQCHKSYYTEQKAEAHRAQCQGKNTERKYNCEECGRSYVMLCSLRTHIRERHSDFKPVKNLCCELCGKRFRHKKYLELHMYSHSSEKNVRKHMKGLVTRPHLTLYFFFFFSSSVTFATESTSRATSYVTTYVWCTRTCLA